ncbi:MAG: trypsin-like peptidase domain-containing protein, partial [Pseudomonadota bacterium]
MMLAIRSPKGSYSARFNQGWFSRFHSAFAIVAMLFSCILANQAIARQTPESFADLVENLQDAVVNIRIEREQRQSNYFDQFQAPPGSPFEDFFRQFRNPDPNRKIFGHGSGFIISEDGLVVTNNHVIEDAINVEIVLLDGSEYKVEIVGTDPRLDLALLRIAPNEGEALPEFASVKFGDSNKIRIGDWTVAIGNPLGLGGTVTAGIVSARGRDIAAGPYDDFIQTDASINRGNSGGPLFNMDGEVIGVNTAILSNTGGSVGLGFAIPSSQASLAIEQLRLYGQTRRGWLGVRIQNVTEEIAESLGLDRAYGALVGLVNSTGPAQDA